MMRHSNHLPLHTALCLSAVCALALVTHAQAQPASSSAPPPNAGGPPAATLKLRWPEKPRVRRYRLQLARDQEFNDIVFDRAVIGLEQDVTGLQPGQYYWRVAPATKETGRYSTAELVAARLPAAPAPLPAVVMRPPAGVGWQAAVGAVARPLAAHLRAARAFDLLAVNTDGTVYALDGGDGSALWVARFRPNARRGEASGQVSVNQFTPFVLSLAKDNKSAVVVAFDGGIRELDGETGRELWRTSLQGRPVSGMSTPMGGEGHAADVVVTTNDPAMLYVLEGQTGRIVSGTKLSGEMIGPPISFTHNGVSSITYTLKSRALEIRRRDGSLVQAIKFDVPFATPPLVIAAPSATLVVAGTEHGLLFLEGVELRPLGRITTENDSPRGRLAAADIDGNGTLEIAMVTQRNRLAIISAEGKINWSIEVATDAYAPTFANLNNDGFLDVLVTASAAFALGFSGRDGTLIWRVDGDAKVKGAGAGDERALRTLTGAASSTGVPLLVGGDISRSVVRAVGLPTVINRAGVK